MRICPICSKRVYSNFQHGEWVLCPNGKYHVSDPKGIVEAVSELFGKKLKRTRHWFEIVVLPWGSPKLDTGSSEPDKVPTVMDRDGIAWLVRFRASRNELSLEDWSEPVVDLTRYAFHDFNQSA